MGRWRGDVGECLLVPGMKFGGVDGRAEPDFAMSLARLQIPENGRPALAGRQEISTTPRPAQRGDVLGMTPELACYTHGVEVPDDDGAINPARGKVVALAVEAHTC